jgi:Na+/H+-dicarboxylate symporter
MFFQALMTIVIFCVLLGISWLVLQKYSKTISEILDKLRNFLNDGKPKRRKKK